MDQLKNKKKKNKKKENQSKIDDDLLWDYSETHGPEFWIERFPNAGGNFQSPIDIILKDITKITVKQPLLLNGSESYPKCDLCKVQNTGLTVQAIFPGKCNKIISVEGGILSHIYTLGKVEFHWGSGESKGGSEHFFAGKSFAGEMHYIFYKRGLNTIDEALEHSDGILIICIFIDTGYESKTYHPEFELFLIELKAIQKYDSSVYLPSWYLVQCLKDRFTPFGWLSYHGSLTTPPCTENVTWIIFLEPLQAANKYFSTFVHMEDFHQHKLGNNRRPVQPLNNRPIFRACSRQVTQNLT